MIFASDLDQTMIYSKRFLMGIEGDRIVAVEAKKGKDISYMTKTAIAKLKQLASEILFVPVTTRTIDQYHRIHLFAKDIKPKYVITSNGGNLLIAGKIDLEWRKRITERLKGECIELEEVLEGFRDIQSPEWVLDHRVADELFSCCLVDREKLPSKELQDFKAWLEKNNWSSSLQGRKLYFVPQCVCKGAVLEYIKEVEGCGSVMAAGDSLLDLPMLRMADYAVCPAHGELNKHIEKGVINKENIEVTRKEGIFAAEEILERVSGYHRREME